MAQALRVAFRVDASQAIGTGHVRRCLALAQALKRFDALTYFICRHHDDISVHVIPTDQQCRWLTDTSTSILHADEDSPTPHAAWGRVAWHQDAEQTVLALEKMPVDWLVVDHYAWDARWHQRVAGGSHARILVIDDLADRSMAADALLNQNLNNEFFAKYKDCIDLENGHTRLMTGPRYALLSDQYSHVRRYKFSNAVNSIGIFMSGTDPDDLTSRVFLACREHANFKGDVTIVSSAKNPHFQRHTQLATKWPRTKVVFDLPDLSGFFADHDLQIGAGGGAAWERCCIGAPTLAVVAATNQQAVLPPLADLQAVRLVELTSSESSMRAFANAVVDLVENPKLREQLAHNAISLVDGHGSARVATVLALSVLCELSLRPATVADEQLLFDWFNDDQARQNAFNPEPITASSHAKWLQATLEHVNSCRLYIAQAKSGVPLGMIRFDRDVADGDVPDHESWSLSYSVDLSFRGLRIARSLVSQGIENLCHQVGRPFVVKALVKTTNVPSIKVFASLSFADSRVEHLGETVCSFQKPVGSL